MLNPLSKTLICGCLALSLVATLHGRDFTSSDGKQTLSAEFVRYDKKRDKVTLRLENGRNMVTEGKLFSESDRKFFDEQARTASVASAIDVEVEDNSETKSQAGHQVRMRVEKLDYDFQVRNRSDFAMQGLKIKYWVVTGKGDKVQHIYKDDAELSSAPANGTASVSGPKITLVKSARATCECPTVIAQAKKMGGQKVIGVRLEVYGSDGNLLYENSSSSKVDKAIKK